MSIIEESPPVFGPWWNGGSFGGGALGLNSLPEEIPLTLAPDGQLPIKGSKSHRQMFVNPSTWGGLDGLGAGFGCGVNGIMESNGSTPYDAMRKATGKLASTYYNYRRMRADGIVAIGREVADGLICTNQWTYEAAEGCDEAGEDPDFPPELIDEMKTAIKKMWEGRGDSGKSHEGYTLREYFLSESCRAKDFGNATLEVAWDDGEDGAIELSEFLPLLPENTRPLVFAGTRQFAGVRNYGLGGGPVDLDPPYCIRFIYDGEGGDLGGRSRFENCKRAIESKWKLFDKLDQDMDINIGNTPVVTHPTGKTDTETATFSAMAGTINILLRRGMGVTKPGWSAEQLVAMAKNGIDASKCQPWSIDRLATDGNSFAAFKTAMDLLDEQILFGLLTLPRTVREADHGAKADAEQHTDTAAMMAWRWITYVVGMANNITNTFAVQRWGAKARGKVLVKAIPITDESLAVLKAIFTTLLSDKELAVKIVDIKAGLEKLKIKPLPGFDQDAMADQMAKNAVKDDLSSSARLANAGHTPEEIAKIQEEKAEIDVVPTDADGLGGGPGDRSGFQKTNPKAMDDSFDPMAFSEDDGEGRWITIDGAHVFIGKGGAIEKGPSHMVGKKLSEVGGKKAEASKTAGWKLHLNVPPDENHPTTKAVSEHLKKAGIPHKIGHSGGQEGKGLTAYVGERDKAEKVAASLHNKFGEQLGAPGEDVLKDDQKFMGNVFGRFDADDKGTGLGQFHQYGAKGIPFLYNDSGPWSELKTEEKARRAHTELVKRFGEFYTGSPWYKDPGHKGA